MSRAHDNILETTSQSLCNNRFRTPLCMLPLSLSSLTSVNVHSSNRVVHQPKGTLKYRCCQITTLPQSACHPQTCTHILLISHCSYLCRDITGTEAITQLRHCAPLSSPPACHVCPPLCLKSLTSVPSSSPPSHRSWTASPTVCSTPPGPCESTALRHAQVRCLPRAQSCRPSGGSPERRLRS